MSDGCYPEADGSLGQLTFQLAHCYAKKDKLEQYQKHQRLDLTRIQYDFSLENEVKRVFEQFDQLTIDQLAPEVEEDEAVDDDAKITPPTSPPPPQPPAIPKRGFEVSEASQKENDSGVSSGGETNTSNNPFNEMMQPTCTSQAKPIFNQKATHSSVLDIFDVRRNDDPFDAAQLNSLDEKQILAQVFINNNTETTTPPPKTPPTIERTPPEQKKQAPSLVSSLQNVLAQRQVQRQMEKNQNFNKSAMAALNSLPVIGSSKQTQRQRQAESPTPTPLQTRSIFPIDAEQLGEQLAAMGYERLIVLKAIQLFGMDEHKCIDFLSAHSELASSTNQPSSDIVKALTVCEFSSEETRLFLQKSKRYLEMGFDHKGC